MLAARTIRAAAALDTYEYERKTATNHEKEKLLSVARRKVAEVTVGGRVYQYAEEATVLGLKLSRCGFSRQTVANRGKGYGVLKRLKRFKKLPRRHKLQLYKQCIRPVLEYPAVPLHAGTPACMKRLQSVQNASIMWIFSTQYNDPTRPSIEQLHRILRLDTINVRLHKLAKRTWDKLQRDDDPNFEEVLAASAMPAIRRPTAGADPRRWWPSSFGMVNGPAPVPIFRTANRPQ